MLHRRLEDMGRDNEALARAGVLLAGAGLRPSSRRVRVRFSGTRQEAVDRPFAESKDLLAGFWPWQVRSMDEAVEWVRRCPNPHEEDTEVESRPVFQSGDIAAEPTAGPGRESAARPQLFAHP